MMRRIKVLYCTLKRKRNFVAQIKEKLIHFLSSRPFYEKIKNIDRKDVATYLSPLQELWIRLTIKGIL